MSEDETRGIENEQQEKFENVRDLSEFCQKWPRLRPIVSDIETTEEISSEEVREIVKWLVLLADRVCFREEYF
jgi:hypothetical protein